MTARNFIHTLDKPVAIAPLVTFRVIFGVMMLFSTIRFISLGWIDNHYLDPVFHFKYFGFHWVEALPPYGMYAVHTIMILASLGIILGLYYRFSALLLFITFTYTELIDLTYYLNHYYFVSIVAAMMVILPANRYFSLDILRKPGIASEITPAWTILIIKFQLIIVYLYAGLAKINYDWLINALPLKIWLPANDKLPLIGSILALPWMPYVFSWLGMLYDCTIVFWLMNKKTRVFAYATVIFFHLITGLMFQIGVFPLVMIGATLIFFSEARHQKAIALIRSAWHRIAPKPAIENAPLKPSDFRSAMKPWLHPAFKYLIIAHFIFQLLFPWRYLLYPGNLFWTEEGYRFSWRVMLMEKAGTATFYVKDTKTEREGVVVNSEFLNPHQEKQMAMQPDMILQFAHFLHNWYAGKGVYQPEVRAEVYVTLNARPSRLLIDPSVNLAAIHDGWNHKTWILPFKE